MKRICIAALLLASLTSAAARAERATERYAPVQLEVAQDFLDRARAAAATADFAAAGRYAWQASLDARLAWGMSDSAVVRSGAAAIAGEADALAHRLSARTAQALP